MHLAPINKGPIIFNRFNRSHFLTQPNRPVEYYLDEYERNVLGMKSRWILELQDQLDQEVKLKALKIIRSQLGLNTRDAFKVLEGDPENQDPISPKITGLPLTLLRHLYLLFNNELIPCSLHQTDEG